METDRKATESGRDQTCNKVKGCLGNIPYDVLSSSHRFFSSVLITCSLVLFCASPLAYVVSVPYGLFLTLLLRLRISRSRTQILMSIKGKKMPSLYVSTAKLLYILYMASWRKHTFCYILSIL